MENAYVLDGLRSHIGLKGGIFSKVQPEDLAAALLQKLLQKQNLRTVDMILCGNAVGTGGNIARLMALKAGIDRRVPAVTIDMQCASGAASIDLATAKIQSGQCDIIAAGGFESSSLQPLRRYAPDDARAKNGPDTYHVAQFSPEENSPLAMLEGAERVAQRGGISREELDDWALKSHRRAIATRGDGSLRDVIAPLFGSIEDEGIRNKMNPQLLKRMPLLLGPNTVTTAGNTCLINDGAAFVLLCSKRFLQEMRLTPRAVITASGVMGCDPLLSPLGAMQTADDLLYRNKLSYENLTCIEFNEAFAVIDALFARRFPHLTNRYNRFGGALAYGHPYGASGAIILLHLLCALEITDGTHGICSIAGAGGLGCAILLRRYEHELL